MAGRLVNHKELASILEVSQATLTTWHRDYGMPMAVKGSRGKVHSYNISEVFRWYGTWQVDKVLAQGHEQGGKVIVLKTEEARLKKHQADKAEVEAQIVRGEVLMVEDIKEFLNTIATTYGSQLDALGGRLANELAAIDDPAEIRERLFAEGRRIRETTADALTDLAMQAVSDISEFSESAASTNS